MKLIGTRIDTILWVLDSKSPCYSNTGGRRWLRKAEQAGELVPAGKAIAGSSRMVPVQLAAPVADPASPIRVHIQRGSTQIHVEWPASSAAMCGEWLQDWLR